MKKVTKLACLAVLGFVAIGMLAQGGTGTAAPKPAPAVAPAAPPDG